MREEEDDEVINLDDIPEASKDVASNKRRRGAATATVVSSGSDTDDSFQFESAPSTKRTRRAERKISDIGPDADEGETQDDKKKLGLNTSYDGFSIYGRILCLIVKRKGPRTTTGGSGGPISTSQHMLENWVSTQAAAEQVGDDDDNG